MLCARPRSTRCVPQVSHRTLSSSPLSTSSCIDLRILNWVLRRLHGLLKAMQSTSRGLNLKARKTQSRLLSGRMSLPSSGVPKTLCLQGIPLSMCVCHLSILKKWYIVAPRFYAGSERLTGLQTWAREEIVRSKAKTKKGIFKRDKHVKPVS